MDPQKQAVRLTQSTATTTKPKQQSNMSSISYAISAVDASHETIKIALRSGAKISNEDEAREARTAKTRVFEQ